MGSGASSAPRAGAAGSTARTTRALAAASSFGLGLMATSSRRSAAVGRGELGVERMLAGAVVVERIEVAVGERDALRAALLAAPRPQRGDRVGVVAAQPGEVRAHLVERPGAEEGVADRTRVGE